MIHDPAASASSGNSSEMQFSEALPRVQRGLGGGGCFTQVLEESLTLHPLFSTENVPISFLR